MMPAAIRTTPSWPPEIPSLAALPIQSRVRNAPTPRMTRLASHGVSVARAQVASVASIPRDEPGAEPAAPPGSFSLASCAWQDRATAATAVTTPMSAAGDQWPDPPKPKNRTTWPSAPVLWYSRAMSGGAASMSSASAAVMAADQPTRRARQVPRPGLPEPSVAHQKMNRISVTLAAMTGAAAHQGHTVTDAAAPPFLDQVSTPWARISQPQAWSFCTATVEAMPAPRSCGARSRIAPV